MNKSELVSGNLYVVVKSNGHAFSVGDVVKFHRDAGSNAPVFKRESDNKTQYVRVDYVKPYVATSTLQVGATIKVVKAILSHGRYKVGDIGTVQAVDTSTEGANISFQTNINTYVNVYLFTEEFEVVTPANPLEHAKLTLSTTQAAYDKASSDLDAAKDSFKVADAAHGKAIEALNKATREAEAQAKKFTQDDIKNLMVVETEIGYLRLVVIAGDTVKFFNDEGKQTNSCDKPFLLKELNMLYQKTDRKFTTV